MNRPDGPLESVLNENIKSNNKKIVIAENVVYLLCSGLFSISGCCAFSNANFNWWEFIYKWNELCNTCQTLVIRYNWNGWKSNKKILIIEIYTGAIFDESNVEAQIAFKHAMFRENMFGAKFSLEPVIKVIDTKNTYLAEQAGKSSENSF